LEVRVTDLTFTKLLADALEHWFVTGQAAEAVLNIRRLVAFEAWARQQHIEIQLLPKGAGIHVVPYLTIHTQKETSGS
jgi:hypothetical protein